MKFIKTKFFTKQLNELSRKYPKTEKDFLFFEEKFDLWYFSDLWNWFFKYRLRNSSIPVWKRWWFRIIIKIYQNKVLPLIIYSKILKENVNQDEIIYALEQVLKEL